MRGSAESEVAQVRLRCIKWNISKCLGYGAIKLGGRRNSQQSQLES